MSGFVFFRRLIRSKGSTSAKLVGGPRTAMNVKALIAHAKRTRHVYAFIDENGNEGTIRSGVLMRRVDSHVRNIVPALGGLQTGFSFDSESVDSSVGDMPAPQDWNEISAA